VTNSYPPLQLGTPGAPACPDQFSSASTTSCAGCTRLLVQISNAAVYIQFGTGIGGIQWGVEEPYLPLVGGITRSFDAVRVRNFAAGVAAQVLLTPVAA
jgi:hypothetical protein